MKVLHISNSVSTQSAAYRLHRALIEQNIDSYIYVKDPSINDKKVIRDNSKLKISFNKLFYFFERRILKYFQENKTEPFNLGLFSTLDYNLIKKINPDIINIHWACGQFVSINDLKFLSKYKLVWTLHDSWGFTGGCHLPYNCLKYEYDCSNCEKIKIKFDLPKYILNQKYKIYNSIDFAIVTPSKWLSNCCKNSKVLKNKKISTIGNPLNISFFKAVEKNSARNILNLPIEKKIIAFGAVNIKDKNKGFDYLVNALKLFKEKYDYEDIALLVFGNNDLDLPKEINYEIYYLGYLNDAVSLKLVYSAADVFVLPSKSENLPNVIMEAMACSTTTVAFNVGGIADMVEHKINGYLAKPFDVNDLCYGIDYIFKNKNEEMQINARNKIVENYSNDKIAKQYIALYKNL